MNGQLMKLLLPLMLVGTLVGCASNPFSEYYRDYTKQFPPGFEGRLLPPTTEPRVISVSLENHREEARRLQENRYVAIGEASFRGGAPTKKQLSQHAREVAAEVVLFSSEFSHTEEGIEPILTYEPGTSSTTTQYGTVNANAYGSGGYAYASGNYSGTSTTTTPGKLQTRYVPYQRQVYDYGATFWRRMKPGAFGARLSTVPEEMRAALQRNTGAYVELVMLDSPAFKANIMRGDVVIRVADQPVESVADCIALISAHAGQRVPVTFIRNGQTITVEVQLSSKE